MKGKNLVKPISFVSVIRKEKGKNTVYFTKHHPFKKGSGKSTGKIMEPFTNVIVRKTHISAKYMQFSMQLHRK